MLETYSKLVIDWDKKTVCLINTTSAKLYFVLSENSIDLAEGKLNAKSLVQIQSNAQCNSEILLYRVNSDEVVEKNIMTAIMASPLKPVSECFATAFPETAASATKQSDAPKFMPLDCVNEEMNKALDANNNRTYRKQDKASRGCKYGADFKGCAWEETCYHEDCPHSMPIVHKLPEGYGGDS